MSGPGYPDFQASTQWRGPPLVSVTNRAVGGAVVTLLPATAITNFAYLILSGQTSNQNIELTVIFSDPSGLFASQTKQFSIGQSGFMYYLPVTLDRVTVQAQAASNGGLLELYVAGTNVPLLGTDVALSQIMVFGASGAIGAGGVFDQQFTGYNGPATVSVDASAANWTLRVQQQSLNLAAVAGQSWVHHEGTEFARSFDVWLPPMQTRVRVGNNTGVAQTYSVGVTLQAGSGHGR